MNRVIDVWVRGRKHFRLSVSEYEGDRFGQLKVRSAGGDWSQVGSFAESNDALMWRFVANWDRANPDRDLSVIPGVTCDAKGAR